MRRKAQHLNITSVRRQKASQSFAHKSTSPKSGSGTSHPLLYKLVGHDWFRGLLAEYWIKKLAHLEQGSLRNDLKSFKLLWKFLDYEVEINSRAYRRATDLDPHFISRLISWMSGQSPGKELSDLTKGGKFNTIRRFFNWLKFERKLLPQDWPVRKNPWPLAHKKITSANALADFQVAAILSAAKNEIQLTLGKWDATEKILKNDLIIVPPVTATCSNYKNRDIALKALTDTYPGFVPSRDEIRKDRVGLHRALTSYTHLTMRDLIESRYPTARNIVPFIVTIGMSSFFNPETLLRLKWSEVSDHHPIFGADRWRLSAHKKRGGKLQIRSFPANVTDIANPAYLLRLLKQQTESLRDACDSSISDYVFLFHVVHGKKRDSVFSRGERSNTWDHALTQFIEDNNLDSFSLVNLRATGSDLVDAITNGDIRSQQVMLNHAKVETTERHYTSSASKQRREEKLTAAMAWRERYARSRGKSDSRGKLGSKRAATPGYECFDPFDSPIEGQISGRICSAYGRCPACPMRGLNTHSSTALANLIELRKSIEQAKTQLAPQRWSVVWKPVHSAILRDIKRFPKTVVKVAKMLNPPTLPAIE